MGEIYTKSLLESYIKLEDETLRDSYKSFENSMFRQAANSAYYAMFYSANAALISAGVKLPKTHKSVVSSFSNYYVRTGKLDRKFSRYLNEAPSVRLASTYEVVISPNKSDVEKVMYNAQEFVNVVRKIVYFK